MKMPDWGMKVPTTPKGKKPETIDSIKGKKIPVKARIVPNK